MSNAVPLPWPYLPGRPGSGLGTDLEEFAQNVQQNFDALAIATGSTAGLPVAVLADAVNVRVFAARLNCTNPIVGTGVSTGIGVTNVTRTAAGTFTVTHDQTPGPAGYLVATVTPQGNTGAGVSANFEPLTSTTSRVRVFNQAGTALDGEVVTLIGIG